MTTKWAAGAVPQILQESLSKVRRLSRAYRTELNFAQLGLEFIDLYLIHGPGFIENGDFVKPWVHFEEAKEKGLVRWVQLSQFVGE